MKRKRRAAVYNKPNNSVQDKWVSTPLC